MKIQLISLVLVITITGCTSHGIKKVQTGGPEVVQFAALPFELSDVKLLEGSFLHATELNVKTLLNYEPDRLLSKFYSEAGLSPKAPHYMGWENETLAGHSLGHYLSACSMMYRTTGDIRFLERVNYMTGEMKKIQEKDGSGYIGAFPDGKKILESEVAKGIIRSQGFDLNGIWAPFYTIHKVMAGLRDAYQLCGDTTALEVEKRFADWLATIVTPLTDEQIQEMLRCEHGGISETLADLFADTGDRQYLELSRIFYHKAILDPLKEGRDVLPGKHCNTNIPKLIALARIYELTGDTSDRSAATFFWNTVANHHSYVTGGNGNNEYFGPADKLRDRLGEGTTESCNVYNMLKLSEHLFMWNASVHVADFYERALVNHILAGQNPEDGRVVYNLSLAMGGYKDFQDPYWFTCCIGTGMENHAKYARNIYYHNENDLFIFQFISSELTWEEKGMKVIQKTSFPAEQGTTLSFDCDKPVRAAVQVRYPYWADRGVEILINGRKIRVGQEPGNFIGIDRIWRSGDILKVSVPFSLRLEPMPDDSNRVAVMYGPLVMAGDLGPEEDPNADNQMYVPVLLTENRDPSTWLKPVEDKPNTFITQTTGHPRDFELKPFYSIYSRRYSIYWDMFSEAGWNAKQEEYKAEAEQKMRLREATIDFVQPGEMQPERDHNFRGEKTTPGRYDGRPNRESRGGWFSFDLKVIPESPVRLAVEYWGGFPGAKSFDILANERLIATENISGIKDGHYIDILYDIPESISRGRSKLTIMFRAHPGNMAGPVFGLRTIKTD